MLLSEAVSAFISTLKALQYSPHTIADYTNTFNRFIGFMGPDLDIDRIGEDSILNFLGDLEGLSRKTVLNYHIGLSSLWRWAVENDLCEENIIRKIKAPRPSKPEIEIFTRAEVIALLNAARVGEHPKRDVAIIYILLDTGIRVSELCTIRNRDISTVSRKILIEGKGSKRRTVKFSSITQQAIEDYKGSIPKSTDYQPLFLTDNQKPCTRNTIRLLMERLGERAGVLGTHCHRFRHTFATEYLRHSNNVFALQRLLGHSSLDMIRRYLELVQADIDKDYDRASPVKNWEL